jgi:DNA-binding protein H-NS
MTVQELTALRDAAEAKRREKLEGAKNEVLAETREKLAQLGLTLDPT